MQQDFWVLASALLRLVVINLEKDQSTWLLIFSTNIYLPGKKWRKGGQLSLTRVGVWLNWKDGQEFIVIIMIIHGIQTGKGKKWECEMMGMENHSFLPLGWIIAGTEGGERGGAGEIHVKRIGAWHLRFFFSPVIYLLVMSRSKVMALDMNKWGQVKEKI